VIEDVPVLVSLVAVIVTGPPTATPVTRPFASTVATALLLEDHVTKRPVSTLPFPSLVTAVSCCVPPTTTLVVAGVTVTVLTGASVTVIEDVPVFVSLVAVIVAGPPAPCAVTRPFASTVATELLFEDHVTVLPVSTLPLASFVTTVSCCVGVIPRTRFAEGGETVTVATGASATVIADVPVFVSLVAVITTGPPAATPVTRPVASTVATALLLELHVTVRPLSTVPFASFVTAVSCCVPPTTMLAVGGVTVTVATGARATAIKDVPVFVSLVAVIVTGPPAATPVTRPVASTVATALLLELHVTVLPVSTLPFESFS
jgi:hypothetical protein